VTAFLFAARVTRRDAQAPEAGCAEDTYVDAPRSRPRPRIGGTNLPQLPAGV